MNENFLEAFFCILLELSLLYYTCVVLLLFSHCGWKLDCKESICFHRMTSQVSWTIDGASWAVKQLWLCDWMDCGSEFDSIYSLSFLRNLMVGCKLQKYWKLQRSLKTSLKLCKYVTDASLNLEGLLSTAFPFLSCVVALCSCDNLKTKKN